MRILLLCLGLAFAGELEVEGDLKVSGNIDAQNQRIKNVGVPTNMSDAINAQVLHDALRDDSLFEYLAYKVKINPEDNNGQMEWIILDDSGDNWQNNFIAELNIRALEGYEIHHTMVLPHFHVYGNDEGSTTNNKAFTLIFLKRPIIDIDEG